MSEQERKVVIPGEIIVEGEYLPGENTEKKDNAIISTRYGLAEIIQGLVRVIPLSGVYSPRVGNIVIGTIKDITLKGWLVDINTPTIAFLNVSEFPRFVNKGSLESFLDIDDIAIFKVIGVNSKGIELTMKGRGLMKIEKGMVFEINYTRVPRVIGREGSMVSLIKQKTGCNITVGQNGLVWVSGEDIEKELKARKMIEYIAENSFISGLTDKVNELFGEKNE